MRIIRHLPDLKKNDTVILYTSGIQDVILEK